MFALKVWEKYLNSIESSAIEHINLINRSKQ